MRSVARLEAASDSRTPCELVQLAGLLALVLLLLELSAQAAFGQVAFQIRGLADGELWKTDEGSVLLSRNQGDTAPLGRLHLWGALEPNPRFQLAVLAEFEGGDAVQGDESEHDVHAEIEEALLRFSPESGLPIVFEGGRIAPTVGAFAKRRFSNINPLIGEPDGYQTMYPWGGQVSLAWNRADFRAALIDLPVVNVKYTPEPSSRARPALAAGYSPMAGIRLGGSFTSGPYLGSGVNPFLPAGSEWDDYWERVFGIEAQFSRGYFEVNGEVVFSRYEVPNHPEATHGLAHYTELKYTWSPRLFSAIRFEQNDYAYIQPVSPSFWIAAETNFYDGEAGIGYRLGPETLIKVAYRRDFWKVDDSLRPFLPDGYSVSTQISYGFDVESLLRRPR